jgi:hypothetical protein
MRHTAKILLTIALLFPIVGFALPGAAVAAPHAVFPEAAFDAGSMKEGGRVMHDFVVLNRGDEPLEILRVAPG